MTTRCDNEYLWTEYAAGHAGWCLEFANQDLFMFAHQVIYDEERKIDFGSPSDEQEWKFLYRKTLRYVPEEEVRIFKFSRGQPHTTAFEPSLLKRIILGKNMPDEDQRIIREWCQFRVPALLTVDE